MGVRSSVVGSGLGHEQSSCPACCSFVILRVEGCVGQIKAGIRRLDRDRTSSRQSELGSQSILLLDLPYSPIQSDSNEGKMTQTRRDFLAASALGALGAALPIDAQQRRRSAAPDQQTPGAPPAFGTAPPVGPEVTAGNLCRSGEVGADRDVAGRSRTGCRQLARGDGATL